MNSIKNINFSDDEIMGYARILTMIGPNHKCKFCCKEEKPPQTVAEQNEIIIHFKNNCETFKKLMERDYVNSYINFYVEKKEIIKQGKLARELQFKHYPCMTCSKNFRLQSQLNRHICRCREDNWKTIKCCEAKPKLKNLKNDYKQFNGGWGGELLDVIVVKSKYNALMGKAWQQGVPKEQQKKCNPKLKWIVGYIEKHDIDENDEDLYFYERCIVYKRDMRRFGKKLSHYHQAGDYPCNAITQNYWKLGSWKRKPMIWDSDKIMVSTSRWEQAFQKEDEDGNFSDERKIFELSYSEKLILDEMWEEFKDIEK